MAKRKAQKPTPKPDPVTVLPDDFDAVPVETPVEEPAVPIEEPIEEPAVPIRDRVVTVPLFDGPLTGYVSRHADARLHHSQARTMRRLWLALDERGERLANGKRIHSQADALRWLLERVGGGDGET